MNVINWLIHTSYNHVWHFSESWGEWSSWSQCSEQCLPGESQARTRQCLRSDGEPSDDLTNCKVTEVTIFNRIQFLLCSRHLIKIWLQGGPSNIEIQRCICPSYIETAVSKNDNTSSGKYYFKYWNTFYILFGLFSCFFVLWLSVLHSLLFFFRILHVCNPSSTICIQVCVQV